MVGLNMDGPARDRVLKLIEEKNRIESEIREQTAVLEANGNVGMHGPLVDREGFPRSDIDVYKVRHARHQIICLQNDHKAIMKRIEQGLAEVHSQLMGPDGEGPSAPAPSLHVNGNGATPLNGHGSAHQNGQIPTHQNGHSPELDNEQVFAKVSYVLDGSPADEAGLCSGDEVLQFGSIAHRNFADVSQVHSVVAHSVGQRVVVRVRRAHSILNLTVVPRPWAQPGLLGCQINRIS